MLVDITGLDVLSAISDRGLAVRWLFVSGRLADDDACRLVEAGALGIIEKDATFDEIADAIGRELELSAATVKTYLQRLYDKLGVSDRAAAVAEGMRRGLVE